MTVVVADFTLESVVDLVTDFILESLGDLVTVVTDFTLESGGFLVEVLSIFFLRAEESNFGLEAETCCWALDLSFTAVGLDSVAIAKLSTLDSIDPVASFFTQSSLVLTCSENFFSFFSEDNLNWEKKKQNGEKVNPGR